MRNSDHPSMQRHEHQTPNSDLSDIDWATPQRGEPITVLIAHHHPVIRNGLTTIINSQRDILVVANVADGEKAYWLSQLLLPSVVILDLRLPKKDGIEILRELRSRKTSKPQVLILTSNDTQEDIRSAVCAGAKAFLTTLADPQEICEAVRCVADGETYFPAEVRSKLLNAFSQAELSKREIEVLEEMAGGKSNQEIGAALYISQGTVGYCVSSVLKKLGAVGRAEAIATAVKRGLVRLT